MRLGSITIDPRYHGPPATGNGGYVCGRLAHFVDHPLAVRLQVPPPLDVALEARQTDEGIALMRDDVEVARAWRDAPRVDVPPPPTAEQAEVAAKRFVGLHSHPYPGCFVCGPDREDGDGLRIFPGPVTGRDLVASTWTPAANVSNGDGHVAPEFLWAALDCPGGYAFPQTRERAAVLGEMCADVQGAPRIGEPCVLIGWQISADGRRHFTGTAIFGESGSCLAVARATWFEVRGDSTAPQ